MSTVAIFANDVVPGMGVPVAAPGLRAWGLALGLREQGHEVMILLDQWATQQVWGRQAVPPLPAGVLVVPPGRVGKWVRTHGTDALLITNSNHIDNLYDIGSTRLVYDFFAPKMLELAENLTRADLAAASDQLATRKIEALRRSQGVIVNGAKKVPYVRGWLERAGVADLPLEVVSMGLPPVDPEPPTSGPLRVVVSGYLQPWSRPGAWADAVVPLLDEGLVELHLVVGNHWGPQARRIEMTDVFRRLVEHPAVRPHALLRFGDFRTLLSRCDLSIDVFARNAERELAMITRSIVALSCGLPVMHVEFSEVSPMIAAHDAGWLVDEQDAAAMAGLLRELAADRSLLAGKRAGAVQLARTLRPDRAAAPLTRLLERLR